MILGIDVGATKTRLARMEGSSLVKSEKILTSPDPGRFLADLKSLVRGFCGGRSIGAIGIGAPGPIDLETGMFKGLPNLPGWNGFNLRAELERLHGARVRIHNDANTAALGEAVAGAGRGFRSVFYVTISTGIGAGLVIDEEIHTGAHNLAGEIWALPVWNLGDRDILINSSSGPGMVRNAHTLIRRGEKSSLSSLPQIEPKDVFEHAAGGDAASMLVVETAVENMADAIAVVLLTLDPDVVLLGGGLTANVEYMFNPVRDLVRKKAFFEEHGRANIQRAELWDEAVLHGALALVRE